MLQANGDVHAGAVKAVPLGDHIAEIDADAELHALVFGQVGVALGDLVLNLGGAANGLDDAGEFGDDAVARPAQRVTAMRGNRLFDNSGV